MAEYYSGEMVEQAGRQAYDKGYAKGRKAGVEAGKWFILMIWAGAVILEQFLRWVI